MIGFLFFGILIGLVVSAAQREFESREIIGFSMLGVGGAFYGNFIATMISESLTEPLPFLSPLLIVSMALFFTGIKAVLLRRQRSLKHQSPTEY